MNQMSISFAAIASPAVGGLLYGSVTMPVFLIMYMTASTTAVLLESTMNFKLFAKRKEVVEGEPKESMLQSMKAGLILFTIAADHHDDHLDFISHQLPVWRIPGRLFFHPN